jgi:hypothetical protein
VVVPLHSVLNPLSTHLRLLPDRIREASAISHTRQTDDDLEVLSLVLPHVEAFLLSAEVAAAKAGVAQMVVVPARAVPGTWVLSGVEERRKMGEVVRVGRVDVPAVIGDGDGGEKKGAGGRGREREFDDWGRWDDGGGEGSSSNDAGQGLWFRDESMARRLAAYLQPKETVKTERKEVRVEVREQERKKGLFGGWGKKASTAPDRKPVPGPAPAGTMAGGDRGPVGPAIRDAEERVSMTVRAQEVTFRRENEFGIWESLSGFGVVVTIRVRKP